MPQTLIWVSTTSFQKKYFGLYQVLRRLSDVAYVVQDFVPRKPTEVVHVLCVKPYHDPDKQTETASNRYQNLVSLEQTDVHEGPMIRSRMNSSNLNYSEALSF